MLFYVKIWIFIALLLSSCSENTKNTTETAVFGGGCFWTLDYYFEKIEGVNEVTCIYTGSGSEAVSVSYDPQKVSFSKLCKVFMGIHAPETDYKAQYRSVIQTDNPENLKVAQAIIEDMKKTKTIRTAVEKIGKISLPDEMHEDWHKLKNSVPKCHLPEKSFEDFIESLN